MISEVKNGLSRLLRAVKRGETILILDRDTPVARIEPVESRSESDRANFLPLVKRGVVAPPRRRLDVKRFVGREPVRPTAGASAVKALLDERGEGR